MAVLTANDNSGVLFNALIDGDKITDANGPLGEYIMELVGDFPDMTAEALASKFDQRANVTMEDGDMLPKVTKPTTPPEDDDDDLYSVARRSQTGPVTKSGDFEIAKFDADKQLVFGWAYVSHDTNGEVVVDKSGEFVDDPAELEDAAYLYVMKSRVGGDSHQRDTAGAKKVGVMVESMVFTPEKITKMGIPQGILPTGWWVGFKVEDPEVWKAVKRGERPAFSIHGSGKREEV